MSDIFLSYRRSDQTLARALVEALQARGVDVWWDQKIEGGEDWRDAIVEGLTSAHTVVILFSEECNASKQLKKELAIADTLDKEVVPVLIEDTQPKGHYLYELAARNWLQAHPDPMSRIDQLADRLAREMADNRPVPAVAGEPVGADPAPVAAGSPPAAQPAADAPPPASKPAPPVTARTVETVVEKARAGEKAHKQRRDFLPFKWYEILIAAVVSLLVLAPDEAGNPPANPGWDLAMAFLLILAVIALLVFPDPFLCPKAPGLACGPVLLFQYALGRDPSRSRCWAASRARRRDNGRHGKPDNRAHRRHCRDRLLLADRLRDLRHPAFPAHAALLPQQCRGGLGRHERGRSRGL